MIIILLTIVILNSNLGDKPPPKKKRDTSREMNLSISRKQENQKKPLPRISTKVKFDAAKHIAKAKKQLSNKQETEAEDTLRTILVFEPENMDALTLLGGIFYYSNRYNEAEFIFKKQIEINPKSYLAYNRLASTLAKQNKFDDAIITNSKALSINPEAPEVHINLAGMYSITGQKERALMHFKKAYESFGYAILALSHDSAFDNIRNTPEFQEILLLAKNDLPSSPKNIEDKVTPPPPEQ